MASLPSRPPPYLRDRANLPLPALPALVSTSSDSSSTPEPASGSVSPIRVSVCDVPVLAPRPLPYHSPTFLQFDLPDTDEDLSHPPYTHRPAKRKRNDGGDSGPKIHGDLPPPPPFKRRAHHIHAWRPREQQLPSPRHQRPLLPSLNHVSLRAAPPAPASSAHRSGLLFADQSLGWPNHPCQLRRPDSDGKELVCR